MCGVRYNVLVRGAKQGTCRFKLPHEKSCVWEPVVSAEVSLLALAYILESLPSKIAPLSVGTPMPPDYGVATIFSQLPVFAVWRR